MELLADIIGTFGVASFLLAYFLLQKEKLKHNDAGYLHLNLAGALLVMISLLVNWNLPAFMLEAAWAMISMWGLYKHVYLPKRTTPHDRAE